MLSFRDVTYCSFYKDCFHGDVCERSLTEQVKADAVEWWGNENAPICMFLDPPKCFKEIKKEKANG